MSQPNCRISTAFLFLNLLDQADEVKIPINVIGYFQNLLYCDRGNRRLGPPPGGFRCKPTLNLLSQILCTLDPACLDQTFEQNLEVTGQSIRTLVNLITSGYASDSGVEVDPNQFLSDLRFLVYPNSFYTTTDCRLNLVLQKGPEKFYAITRAFHTLGRSFLQPLIGQRINFDASKWVKLGSFSQFKCIVECVKINGDCISIMNANQFHQQFNKTSFADRIFRDRLILYQAFLNWCLQNTWREELLAFTYSDYHQESNRYGSAITLQVYSDKGETSQVGTVLSFLHSDDSFTPPKPPECPPVCLQNIEGNRGMSNNLYNHLGCQRECDLTCISLMVPIEYWRFIVQLQTDKYPGSGSQHYQEPSYPVGPYPNNCQIKADYESTCETTPTSECTSTETSSHQPYQGKYPVGGYEPSSTCEPTSTAKTSYQSKPKHPTPYTKCSTPYTNRGYPTPSDQSSETNASQDCHQPYQNQPYQNQPYQNQPYQNQPYSSAMATTTTSGQSNQNYPINYHGAMAAASVTGNSSSSQNRRPNFLGSNQRFSQSSRDTPLDNDTSSEVSVSVQTNDSSGFSTVNF